MKKVELGSAAPKITYLQNGSGCKHVFYLMTGESPLQH